MPRGRALVVARTRACGVGTNAFPRRGRARVDDPGSPRNRKTIAAMVHTGPVPGYRVRTGQLKIAISSLNSECSHSEMKIQY